MGIKRYMRVDNIRCDIRIFFSVSTAVIKYFINKRTRNNESSQSQMHSR